MQFISFFRPLTLQTPVISLSCSDLLCFGILLHYFILLVHLFYHIIDHSLNSSPVCRVCNFVASWAFVFGSLLLRLFRSASFIFFDRPFFLHYFCPPVWRCIVHGHCFGTLISVAPANTLTPLAALLGAVI